MASAIPRRARLSVNRRAWLACESSKTTEGVPDAAFALDCCAVRYGDFSLLIGAAWRRRAQRPRARVSPEPLRRANALSNHGGGVGRTPVNVKIHARPTGRACCAWGWGPTPAKMMGPPPRGLIVVRGSQRGSRSPSRTGAQQAAWDRMRQPHRARTIRAEPGKIRMIDDPTAGGSTPRRYQRRHSGW